ncbi:hypothetical protein GCM10010317_071300 [Streptomyces mirabilis]|nr:hypothetical protein GCM10010317_071300 [Streptomyces mirabilis]
MTQHDLPAYGDLVGAEPEGEGLHGERLVDARREIQRADDHVVGVAGALTGKAQHAGETTGALRRIAPGLREVVSGAAGSGADGESAWGRSEVGRGPV